MRISRGHRLLTSTSCVHADIFQIQKVHHSILYFHVTSDAMARPSLKAPARARPRGLVAPPNRKPGLEPPKLSKAAQPGLKALA